ncbi:MAG: sulfotransferase domain-containing protein [Deltaproteobacteria bacterium]|nr:sulfotransferase domain-containing protein [Deltaproteobacteria bacterium]
MNFRFFHKFRMKYKCSQQKIEYPIFLNSLPKSGTHLLSKALTGLPGIKHSGSHLERKKIAEFVDPGVDFPLKGREDIHIPNDLTAIDRLLNTIKTGQFITSHMVFNPPMHNLLKKLNYKVLLLMRDPRDVVLSWANFVAKEKTHLLYPYFSEKSLDYCIACGIKGIEKEITLTRRQPPIEELIRRHSKWKTDGGAFFIKFEDLIGEEGGGNKERQRNVLREMVKFIELECDDKVIDSICTNLFGGTYTFNKGVIGRWREKYTADHIALFKKEAGHLLIELGYESDLNW